MGSDNILIDTGPLVALLNRRDRYNSWVRDTLDVIEPPIFTCEAVISEACFLLSRIAGGANAVMTLLSKEILCIDFRISMEIDALQGLMKKFANVPMSLADACLVRMTEVEPHSIILTLDNDFKIYRRNKRQNIPTIMPSGKFN